tara:strand:+ start:1626 stop:1802 length:177 start_codon:yes stop_codon:yes gene_type:complete
MNTIKNSKYLLDKSIKSIKPITYLHFPHIYKYDKLLKKEVNKKFIILTKSNKLNKLIK